MLQPETILQNRYQIIRSLGQGGMGAVYLAFDLRLQSQVAVKENSSTDPRQFEQEAQLLFKLIHPNLPRVIDHFIEPANSGRGLQYLVMDYIEGQDLEARLTGSGAPGEREVRAWFGQILDAVAYMHANQIIHRDIKPANIRITPKGQAILVDFGIAKVITPNIFTATGAKFGSAGFAAPEQYYGGTDERSDIYALGATMYAVVTRTRLPEAHALEGGSALLVSPRQLNPALSPQLEALILKALQLKPDDRFPSALEMKRSLSSPQPGTADAMIARSSAGVTMPLPPLTVPEVSRRRTRPVQWLALAVTLLIVVALGAFLGSPFSPLATNQNTNDNTALAPTLPIVLLPTASDSPPPPTLSLMPTHTTQPTTTPNLTQTEAADATRVAILFLATVRAQESATQLIQQYNATQTALVPSPTASPLPTQTRPPPTRVPATRVPPTPTPTEAPPTPTRVFFALRLSSPAQGQAFGNPNEAPFLEWRSVTNGALAANEFYRIQVSHGGPLACNIYTKDTRYQLPPTGVAGEGCDPAIWQFNTGDWVWRVSFVTQVDGDASHDLEIMNSEGRLFKWNCDGQFC